ncbi:hypothetical protein [Oceanisphaera sp. W20_SRM_FM3]|uniref:hypothetical protein n=1 Tax=Oceanisphaera sp. W20_SRM_FM3 TaxID=3240267 RepID=UPI003F9E372A
MLKTTSLLILAATSLLSTQAAFASTEQASAKICFSATSNGTDGVDRFQAKMAKLQAERTGITTTDCTPAEIYLNVGSNGTDGVDRFQENFVAETAAKRAAATVSLNMASNGTDGVDHFDSRMRQLATQ